MEIDHIAIVVADLEATILLYTQTLGFSVLYRETVADQGIEAVGLRAGDAVIELLRPLDTDSPIARFRGDAPTRMHHIAYRVRDETPRRGAHGNTIAFLHPKSTAGVLVELCQPPAPR